MFDWLRRKSPAQQRLERINAYIDGELIPAERTSFEQEMDEDAALQAEVDALQALDVLLAELSQVDVPRNFTLSAPRPVPQRSTGRFAPALAGFAMFVLLCGVVFTLLQNGFSSAPEAAEDTVADVQFTTEIEVVEGEAVVEEVIVTQVVEVEVEIAATPLPEPTFAPEAVEEPSADADSADEAADDSDSDDGLFMFDPTRNFWRIFSDITADLQDELAYSDEFPRLYLADYPFLVDFESDVLEMGDAYAIIVDIVPAFLWEDGEWVDSADIAFTYQTCRDLALYAINSAMNGWATACSPDLLLDVIPLSQFSVQFTFTDKLTLAQFRQEIAQTPIMSEAAWSEIVQEALQLEDIEAGRDLLLAIDFKIE